MNAAEFVRDNTRPGHAPLVPEIVLRLASEITPIWQATEDWLAARNVAPQNAICRSTASGRERGRRCRLPTSAIMPILISSMRKYASSAANRRSSANSPTPYSSAEFLPLRRRDRVHELPIESRCNRHSDGDVQAARRCRFGDS